MISNEKMEEYLYRILSEGFRNLKDRQPVQEIKTDFIWTLNRIINEEGFVMNHEKTRLFRDGHKRIVTGINVKDRLSVPRSLKRELKRILFHPQVRTHRPYPEIEN